MNGLTEGKPMSDDEGKALRLKEEGNAALGLAKFAEVRERLLNKREKEKGFDWNSREGTALVDTRAPSSSAASSAASRSLRSVSIRTLTFATASPHVLHCY